MVLIKLENANVDFPVYNTNSFSLRSSFIKSAIGGNLRKQKEGTYTVSALKNISFSLKHGDRLGLIGHNGAGKTTLLKLLAGLYAPTSGKVQVLGKIATIFDVLLGTYEDITGYENLYISSIVRGKSRSEAKTLLKNMADFTELGDYLHMPMRTYSAGMRLRVGFAAATEGVPDILLVDEIFGTGDKGFVNKSIERFMSLIEGTGILIFSSHSEVLLEKICNKLMILEHGEIKAIGETQEILSIYRES